MLRVMPSMINGEFILQFSLLLGRFLTSPESNDEFIAILISISVPPIRLRQG
jgi:hypothetical protein